MVVHSDSDLKPHIEFCCPGAEAAWEADALVIVPKPYGENDPLIFTAAIDFEGGSALMIAYCPFCGKAVVPSPPLPQKKQLA